MRIVQSVLEEAARGVLAAAVAGIGMERALDALAIAADAHGVLIGRNPDKASVLCLSSASIGEAIAEYAAGNRPPDPRYNRVRQSTDEGFAGDLRFFTVEQLRRDAYYNEFLAPRGVGWHGSALLSGDALNGIYVSLKRAPRSGPYEPVDIAALDTALPHLRMAAAFAREKNDLAAELIAGRFTARGDVVLRLAGDGRVRDAEAPPSLADFGLTIRAGRLQAADGVAPVGLEETIAVAAGPLARPGLVALAAEGAARRRLMLAVPIAGPARDIFGGTAALMILIDRDAAPRLRPETTRSLREAFGLTAGEAAIAAFTAAGLPLSEAAPRLQLSVGTARNYLKSVYRKTETGRQAELAALVARLQF